MRRIKDITIVILIVSAFIQLSYIWSISVPNFFAPSYEIVVSEEYKKDILAPNKVYIKQGDHFKLAYYTNANKDDNRGVISLLSEVVNNGEYVENTKVVTDVLNNVDAVYCYPTIIDKEILSEVLEYKGNNLNKVDLSFDYFYVNQSNKEVYFFNSHNIELFKFSADNIENFFLPKNYNFNLNVEYTYNENGNVNNDLFFTPVVVDNNYFNISSTNPYSENNEILVSTVESKINKFFKSPNEKWTVSGEDSYIFSGEDIKVKYYNNNVFEYNNNKDSSEKTDLSTAYAIARSYIDLDECVTNDVILKHFESIENSYKFCFNPIVNNTEVVFDNEYLEYYIEIEVTNGIVKEYKKYALNYNQDFTLSSILSSYESIFELEQSFDNVELVYLQNVEELNTSLHWAMSFNADTVYTKANVD